MTEPLVPLTKPKPARTLTELVSSELASDGLRFEVTALERQGLTLTATLRIKDLTGQVVGWRTATGQHGVSGAIEWRF